MNLFLNEMFGRKIEPGQSFMRIEDRMGGNTIRYYFLAGFVDDKIAVQEYGGTPRTIKRPTDHMMLLNDEHMVHLGITAPTIDDVLTTIADNAAKKVAKSSGVLQV